MDFRQVENIITRNGWILIRTLGNSRQYKKPGCEKAVVITDYGRQDIPIGVVRHLEKLTGLSLER